MNLKKQILAVFMAVMVGSSLVAPGVGAINVIKDECKNNTKAAVCKSQNEKIQPLIRNVINTLIFVIGALAVVMIIVGGVRYTTSNGDEKRIVAAKNTIIYSVVGLVVALLAYGIVEFVIRRVL